MVTAQRRQLLAERQALLSSRAHSLAAQSRLIEFTTSTQNAETWLDALDYGGRRDVLSALGVRAVVRRQAESPRYHITVAVPALDLPTATFP